MSPLPAAARGRPRDRSIDDGVLEATLRELSAKGFAALSLTAVAEAAGTTRPAIYRRWPDKTALVVDAVARLAEVNPPEVTGDPFTDLETELRHFRHCITEAGSLPLVGLMLGDDLDPTVRATYLERIVAPRRSRLRALLLAAVEQGRLPPDADLDVAGSFLTGSWYSYRVSGRSAPSDWPRRVAVLVWRACGGVPPAQSR